MARAPFDPKTGRRRPGRPSTLDMDRIARAALEEIDGLSVAAVARRLGAAQGALYHYVEGRADLVRLAADEALRTWCNPDPALPWRSYLHAIPLGLFTRLGEHPGLDDALLVLTSPPPRLIAALGEAVDKLRADGLDEVTASDAAIMLVRVAYDEARYLRLADGDPGEAQDRLIRRVDVILDGLEWRRSRTAHHRS